VLDPERIPAGIRNKLPGLGIGDVHPLDLFRISWKNPDPSTSCPEISDRQLNESA
jgi:hypothetical protein